MGCVRGFGMRDVDSEGFGGDGWRVGRRGSVVSRFVQDVCVIEKWMGVLRSFGEM